VIPISQGFTGAGSGLFPGSSTDNAIARFDGTTGKNIQNSGITINDSSDLFLASGGVINWANSNYTLTHSTGVLAASGKLLVGAAASTVDFSAAQAIISQADGGWAADDNMYALALEAQGCALFAGTKQITSSHAYGIIVQTDNTGFSLGNQVIQGIRLKANYNSATHDLRSRSGAEVVNMVITAGTVTNQYGVNVEDLSGATNNYAYYTGQSTGYSFYGAGAGILFTTGNIQLNGNLSILDEHGCEFLNFVHTNSAVNEITITNAATGTTLQGPTISATGGDTNISIILTPKGTGVVSAISGIRTKRAVTNTANPPTDAELDTAFGDPTVVGSGYVGILDDNDGGTAVYLCFTTGTAGEWFYIAGTKAT